MMAKKPSPRYFKLDVNYKECFNSIVGVLSQNTITLFKNSILIQAPINVLFYHIRLRASEQIFYLLKLHKLFILFM